MTEDERDAKLRDLTDRTLRYDGRLDGLADATKAFTEAVDEIESLGPMPTPLSPPVEILTYQVRVATAAGSIFRRLGEKLTALSQQAQGERETLLRDLAILRGDSIN